MDIKTGLKLAGLGFKGIGNGVKKGGKELAVIAGKSMILAAAGALVTYATKENNTELNILATKKGAEGINDLEADIANIVNGLK